ncbi:MAG: GNAT family N-acetyltransferase [Eubacterium sp.]|nr:GNAT family N-acetyltransferase [Eubacterium sp.]
MKHGILLLFPGVRYSVDCPLLYYTRVSYSYAGYDIVPIDDYGVRDSDDLTAFSEQAVKALSKRLSDISFDDYERVVFAEKSVGTVIGPMLEEALSLNNVNHIIYTPLDATFAFFKPGRRIIGVAAGTDDKHIEMKALRSACKKLSIPLVEIKNTGHRLEGGKDVTKDIGNVAQVIAQIGDPRLVDKLNKQIEEERKAKEKEAAEKAAAEKAATEKAAAEKAAAEKTAAKAAAGKSSSEKSSGREKAAGAISKFKSNDKSASKLLEAMMEIWLQSNVKEQGFVPKKYWSKNYKEVMRVLNIASVYVYEEDGNVIGFVGSMEEAMVAIYVAEGHRDQGIGSKLLDKIKDEMGILEVSVYTKNKRAMEFFNKNEFKPKDIQVESSTGEEIVLLTW